MKPNLTLLISAVLISMGAVGQPFIDVLNINTQLYNTTYKDSVSSENNTTTYNLNIFIPKSFENGNTFLFRLTGEQLISTLDNTASNLYSFSMPIGFQFVSKSKKWKTLVFATPKISSDLKDNLNNDYQYGGTLLFTYVKNDSLLKLKFGVTYSRECWGNFFVPLVGIDWKASERISVYGILPANLRVEYKASEKLYLGVGVKNLKRSYRLSAGNNNDFVVVRETQAKFFIDYFVWKKILLFADASYVLQFDFVQYAESDLKIKTPIVTNPVYTPMNNNFLFTVGLAYRVRTD